MPDRATATELGEEDVQEAFGRAVGALGRRERSDAEMRELLAARGFAEPVVDEVVARLIEISGLDDERYARLFSEDKRTLSGWGPERIRQALADHGIRPAAIDAAVEPESRDEQLERAVALLGERGGELETDAARARALGFLSRRGFELELCYEAVRRAAVLAPE